MSILNEIRKLGVTHVVWIPDSITGPVGEAVEKESSIKIISACREGEAISIACGLLLGGMIPIVIIQNTGFLEAGDSFRSLIIDLELPLLLLVGYRGWNDTLDSAGRYIEPVLKAWGVRYDVICSKEEASKISLGFEAARYSNRPTIILLQEIVGND